MAAPLGWTVDDADGVAVVAVHGRLDLAATPRLRTVLLKCLAEQPEALLIDLSAMELGEDTCLSLFTAVARQAATWPGTPVLLCAPRPEVADRLARGRHGMLGVHEGVESARREMAAGRVVVPMVSDQLLPLSGAVRHARNLATEACAKWGLPDLVGPASLVVSELVSNAIEHAGTMMTVQLSRRSRYVHIAVRDGSPVEPRLIPPGGPEGESAGRGLVLVDTLSVHWGSLPSRDGKVVWATLAI
jgi:anti-anti-sigma regulatory factor/anti-sigma regulatory factor (Ser/Thr protein kinase)